MTTPDLIEIMTGIRPADPCDRAEDARMEAMDAAREAGCLGDGCHGCAECDEADEDTAPEPRETDSATLLAEAVAIIELLICREQVRMKREDIHFTTHNMCKLQAAQDALAQIRD